MARQDYAQKRRSNNSASRKAPARKRPAPPPPRRTPWGLVLAVLIAVGGLSFLLFQLTRTGAPPQQSVAPAPKPQPVKPKPAPAPAAASTSSKGQSAPSQPATPEQERFQFYEMLPKSEVQTPEVSAYKSTPKTAKLETKILLQTGSFRDPADAEEMRARLILAGLPNVKTSRSEGSNGTWYRVRTGPFDNRAAANVAVNKLYKIGINSPLEIRTE